MVIKKWRAITIENSKMKDHLIGYSEKAGQFKQPCDSTMLDEARKWLSKPECIRIIIEKEEIKNEN